MALFNDAWMEMLLSRSDIVSVVGSYVQLRPKGGRLWGLCPFHGEKTPSFSVVPDKQFYYCFGCHKGGGPVQFIMEIERLSYVEAVRHLAERAGMELPGAVDDEALKLDRARKERLYAACKEAALFYHKRLLSEEGEAAREYLGKRGLSAETVTRFGLGYAPEGWENLMNHLMKAGFSRDELIEGGLLVKNSNSDRVYDAYRNRVIFPIIGANGRVLGFGARAMGDEKPKYINTGDTPIYNKRNNLYALNMQKAAGKLSHLVMVEGYMDVISLFQAGVKNAVASLGTALTQQQARLIKKYVHTVYIAYDGDAAGQNATLRGLDILAAEGLTVRVIAFPEELDPDDFVRQRGKEAFDALRDQAVALSAFKLLSMAAGYDLADPNGREEYARAACRFIAGLEPVEQERYYLTVSRETGISLAALKAQGLRSGVVSARAQEGTPDLGRLLLLKEKAEEESRDAEKQVLWAALASAEATALVPENFEFSKEGLKALFLEIKRAYQEGHAPNGALIVSALPPEQAKEAAAILQKEPPNEPVQTVRDCLKRIAAEEIRGEIAVLRARMGAAETPIAEKLALVRKSGELEARLRALN